MKQISLLIKPSSSLCNMQCAYCFYEDVSSNRENASMGIMSEETMKALIDQTMALNVEQINYCFQGGEPTVADLDFFRSFVNYVEQKRDQQKITYAIQTNGYRLNDEWVNFFAKYQFLVGVSLDGMLANHNRVRKNKNGQGTFKEIIANIKKIEKAHVSYNILTVLTHELAKKPKELFKFYQEQNFKYIQLIPCLPTLEGNDIMDRFALRPKDFASFYKTFFDEWYQAYLKGQYYSVTLFDNVIPMYLQIPPEQCGMLGKCHMQLVVEGNGNVYPCDFYVLDEYCCGNINENSILEIMSHAHGKKFLSEPRDLCQLCSNCKFEGMCHGNCRRLSSCYYDKHYCGYQEFLAYSQEKMIRIAQALQQNQ